MGGVAVMSSARKKPEDTDAPEKERAAEPRRRDAPVQPGPSWADVVAEVIQQFLGPRRRAGTGFYSHPDERHERVLQRSRFAQVEVWRQQARIVRTVDEVIGLQYSTSYCSPALLGDRKSEFERLLRARLLELEPANSFIEDYEIEALCARWG